MMYKVSMKAARVNYGYMMELDPKYCNVIIQRWQRLTGLKYIKE